MSETIFEELKLDIIGLRIHIFFHISSRRSILFPSIFQFDLIAFVADDDREILKLRIGDELDCIIVTTEVRHTEEDFFFPPFL